MTVHKNHSHQQMNASIEFGYYNYYLNRLHLWYSIICLCDEIVDSCNHRANRPYQVSTLIPEGGAVPLRDQNETDSSIMHHCDIGEDTHHLYLGGDAYSAPVVYEPGTEPILFLGRGYTGHEHIPWFGLINMNARLYDPAIGRFLSPDPYVQAPDFTQNLNRYSYCLNNPFKYSDPNGEFIISTLVAVGIGATLGSITGGIIGYMNGARGWNLGAHIGLGAFIGGTSVTGGALVNSFVGSGFYAMGAIGATSGAIAGAGFGALSSGGDWNSIRQGAINGAIGGFLGGGIGSLIGGGWGAGIGGGLASGTSYVINNKGLNNIDWPDFVLTMIAGGLISYGTYELATYLYWKTRGNIMGDRTISYRQYRTMQADIQRSRSYKKEYGGFLKNNGRVKRFPSEWRYSHGISSDNSGTIPLELDAEAMYHTHWDIDKRNILLNLKGDQYFQAGEEVIPFETTLYHSQNDFLSIDSFVINRYNHSFNPANSMHLTINSDNFIRYSPFYYFKIK